MTELDAPPPAPNRVPHAAAIYFALVFAAGLLLGPVRVIWIEPWLGNAIAVVLEAPFLIAAMWFASRAAPKWAGVSGGWPSFLAIGVVALVMQQIADLAVGFGLRGMTLRDQLAHFATPAGMIYAATLIIFAFMPLVRMRRVERDMKHMVLVVASVLALSACQQGEEPLDGRWRVQQIAGASLGEDVEIWMTFDTANETVSGFTGCNHFSAPLSVFSESISIGPPNEEAGECNSIAAATDEQRFLMVLPQIQRHIVRGKSLELLQAASGSETLIRLRREDVQE